MIHLLLKRVSKTTYGRQGVLLCDGWAFAVTLERPWLGNRASEKGKPGSCIPEGTYTCVRVQSPKFGNTFEITDVDGRSHILFHKGNLSADTHGCILVGEMFEPLNGVPAIQASGQGYGEFMALLAGVDKFILTITKS